MTDLKPCVPHHVWTKPPGWRPTPEAPCDCGSVLWGQSLRPRIITAVGVAVTDTVATKEGR